MNQELQIPFRIVKVEEKQFSMFDEVLAVDAPIKQNIGFGFGANADSKTIAVSLRFQLQKNNQPLLKTEITCFFEIEESAFNTELIHPEKIVLPFPFAKHLAMITTGTARGVLYANTKGTEFNKFILGLIDVDKMFTENVDIPL